VSTGFGEDLRSRIQGLISDALNDTDKITNSSTLLSNLSNLSSSNILISKNKITSTINSNDSDSSSSSSIIKDQVNTINGVCNSIKVGGNGNDTLASTGNCNDELAGGAGADKFMCGEGNDTVRDYNSKEGDIILDKQNCEKIQ
jgi:Ca2+-binding RTX toxin-like protein